MIYVVLYLFAIVAANMSVSWFGAGASIVNAFLFIGLDLTARDKLHDAWHGRGLVWKMGLLILAGSTLTVLLNWAAWRIALASTVAFAAAAMVDALTYHMLRGRARLLRVNGSNVPSALVDSFLFPALAFGFPLLWGVMLGQFAAKVGGGFIWSLILRGRHDDASATR